MYVLYIYYLHNMTNKIIKGEKLQTKSFELP